MERINRVDSLKQQINVVNSFYDLTSHQIKNMNFEQQHTPPNPSPNPKLLDSEQSHAGSEGRLKLRRKE